MEQELSNPALLALVLILVSIWIAFGQKKARDKQCKQKRDLLYKDNNQCKQNEENK